MATKVDAMIGRKFGRLTVEAYHSHGAGRMLKYTCRCECGGMAICYGNNLRTGTSKSCGCLQKERTSAARTTHGKRHTRVWQAWMSMKNRCYTTSAPGYKNYGGRGISVCERWRHSFENFYADMGEQPTTKHTLERLDTNGNYEPENCEWATYTKQARNKRSNRMVDLHGDRRCLAEWIELLGLDPVLVKTRIGRGWSAERALTTPKKQGAVA